MTDPGPDDAQDAVRRLLAESRHDAPMPEAVRARLDDVLAGLTAERRELRPTEPVTELSARRRRVRRAFVLAAAAVVVAGVGLGQVLDDLGGSDQMAGDATSASRDGSGPVEDRAGSGLEKAEPPAAMSESRSPDALARRARPAVRSTRLRADLQEVLGARAAASADASGTYDDASCQVPSVGPGDRVPIILDGDPAVAVLGPASDGLRQVVVYDCSGTQLRSLELRAR